MKISTRQKLVNYFQRKIKKQETVIEPFYKLAKELLNVNNRKNQPDNIPVFECNRKTITIGNCRNLIEIFEKEIEK